MVKLDIPYLDHIKAAISLIESYIQNMTLASFKKDPKTRDAVIRQLEVIGEAASKLESNFKTSHREIPWREITDFRNVLAHEYWDVDIEIVWKTATQELQDLKSRI